MSNAPNYRLLLPQETAAAERVLKAAFEPLVRQLGRTHDPETYRQLPDAVADARVYGALIDGNIVGVAVVNRSQSGWKIDELAVAPERHGNSLGSQLLQFVEAEARTAGAPALSLHTPLIMDRLVSFYQRHGFRESHRALPEHGLDNHLRVHMNKSL